MSYQPLFLGLGTAVISTSASTSYLEGETANLRFGQALVFQDNTFGGVPTNSVVYVKEVIDANNFTISAALDGIVLELDDGTGFMIAKSVQRENVGESLKKVDDMLDEIRADETSPACDEKIHALTAVYSLKMPISGCRFASENPAALNAATTDSGRTQVSMVSQK